MDPRSYLRFWLDSSSSDTTPLHTSPVEKLAFSSAPSKPPFASLFFFFPKSRLKGWNLPCRLLSVWKNKVDDIHGRMQSDHQSLYLALGA